MAEASERLLGELEVFVGSRLNEHDERGELLTEGGYKPLVLSMVDDPVDWLRAVVDKADGLDVEKMVVGGPKKLVIKPREMDYYSRGHEYGCGPLGPTGPVGAGGSSGVAGPYRRTDPPSGAVAVGATGVQGPVGPSCNCTGHPGVEGEPGIVETFADLPVTTAYKNGRESGLKIMPAADFFRLAMPDVSAWLIGECVTVFMDRLSLPLPARSIVALVERLRAKGMDVERLTAAKMLDLLAV